MVTEALTAIGTINPQGYCSKCGKVWTLKKGQGVCPWCGKLATCQTGRTPALRSFKSKSSRNRKQAVFQSNGYDCLSGEWAQWYRTAQRFEYKVPLPDREDIRHDIILELAKARARDGDKPFTEGMMYRIGSFVVADYWRKEKRKPNCLSLENELINDNGDTSDLIDTVADDRAIDLDAWLDARTFILGFPQRLIQIAHKKVNGTNLSNAEMKYLCKLRKREQKYLFGG